MRRRDAVLGCALVGLIGSACSAVSLLIGPMLCARLPRDERAATAAVVMFVFIAGAVIAITAVITLISESIAWHDEVRFARQRARADAAYLTHPSFTPTPLTRPAVSIEQASEAMLRDAITRRDEALRAADHMTRVLNMINEELSK